MNITAVRTTKIFCRPGCPARPKPENTERFSSVGPAIVAGYRPCKRCRPLDEPARKAAPEGPTVHLAAIETPLGPMVAAATAEHIVLLEFANRRMLLTQFRRVGKAFDAGYEVGDTPLLRRLRRQLTDYFAGTRRDFDLPLSAPGTAFQERVWRQLRTIPSGTTRSYAQLARANGDNRLTILVPCHRVVGSDGSLTGYSGGLKRKRWLIEAERLKG